MTPPLPSKSVVVHLTMPGSLIEDINRLVREERSNGNPEMSKTVLIRNLIREGLKLRRSKIQGEEK